MRLSAIAWIVIGIACGIVEVFSLGFWFLWLALAALLTGLGVSIHILPSLTLQLIGFAVLTLVFIVFTRPLVMRFFKTRDVKSNVDSLVGLTGTVVEDITPLEFGRVKLYGDIWIAKADQEIPEGRQVVVQSVEGVKLYVEPVE